MANHLREFVEAIDARRIGFAPAVISSGRYAEVAGWSLARASEAICFDVGDVESVEGMAIINDIARLPYQCCWIEMGQGVGGDGIIVGVMATEIENGMLATVWHRVAGAWSYFFGFTTDRSEKNHKFFDIDPAEVDIGKNIVEIALAFLSALNCTNVRRIEHKPDAKLQKARAKRGKQPLFSYWTLELDLSRPESSESLGGTHASPRLHLRRGHPRQYAPGKYTWVQPCVVGNKAAGMVHKDYRVNAGAAQ